jgi:hypothetical protein
MNYSNSHQHLASTPDTYNAYDYPEKYLGPNYASVLNFWWHLETLTKEQLLELEGKYKLKNTQYNNRYNALLDYAELFLGWRKRSYAVHASRSHVRGIIGQFPNIPAPVTLELMAMHTILDRGEDLIFVPLISF